MTDKQLLEIGIEIKKPTANRKDNQTLLEPIIFSRYMSMRIMEFIDTIFKLLSIEQKIITTQNEQSEFNRLKKISLEKGENNEFIENTNQALIEIEASVP